MEYETIVEIEKGEFERMISEMSRGQETILSSSGWRTFFFLVGMTVGYAIYLTL